MRRRGATDEGLDDGWKSMKDTEAGSWHAAPPPLTTWAVTRILLWIGVVVLCGTILLNVAETTRSKVYEVQIARDVAMSELVQPCCRIGRGTVITPETAGCAGILASDTAKHGRNRCEHAKEILERSFVFEVAAAVWKHYVPLGRVSLADFVARFGIDAISMYLGQYAMRRLL